MGPLAAVKRMPGLSSRRSLSRYSVVRRMVTSPLVGKRKPRTSEVLGRGRVLAQPIGRIELRSINARASIYGCGCTSFAFRSARGGLEQHHLLAMGLILGRKLSLQLVEQSLCFRRNPVALAQVHLRREWLEVAPVVHRKELSLISDQVSL